MTSDLELLSSIREANARAGVNWNADITSMTHVSTDEAPMRLGYVPGPGELSLEERLRVSLNEQARPRTAKVESPAQWDWRSQSGRSFISSPEDQGQCGTCVAFATAGAIDAMMRLKVNIATADPSSSLVPNLSEGQLFFCGGPGDCSSGWGVEPALNYAQATGLVSEASYGYTASGAGCSLPFVKNWQSQTTKISGWTSIRLDEVGADAMKKWIATTGPLIATMAVVYEDFTKYYGGGVYKWNGSSPKVTTDGRDMGHALCVIGYDDTQQAWLCKNSWGTGWGMGGYCYIAYGQCGIDAQMWGINGLTNVYPFFPAAGTPASCIYEGQAHYAYRDTSGSIHDVIWNGTTWTAVQVTGPGGQTDGPAAVSDPSVVVYAGTGFNQMHYFYRDANNYIWDAQWTGHSWLAMQVTGPNSLAGGPPAGGDPTVIVYAKQLHCVFFDNIGFNVMDAVCADRWSLQNVTTLAKGQVTANTVALVVRTGASYNQMHYCYRDGPGNIWDSQWTGSTWVSTQVTGAKGMITTAPLAVGDPAVILYADQMHYVYRDGSGTIWDAIQNGDSWGAVQVAGPNGNTAGTPAAVGDPALFVYSGSGYNQMHYCYRDASGNIWDAQWTGYKWFGQNVTSLSGAPAAASDPAAFVYGGTGFSQLHYSYRDTNGQIQDMVWSGTYWYHQLL